MGAYYNWFLSEKNRQACAFICCSSSNNGLSD
jgi:hypothetical protein